MEYSEVQKIAKDTTIKKLAKKSAAKTGKKEK